MRPLLLCLGLLICSSLLSLHADEIDASFILWKETMESSAKKLGETVSMKLDREKKLLIVAKELQLNPMRKNTQLQIVPFSFLSPEIILEGVARLPEPWIKLRTQDNQKRVNNQRRVIIEGLEVEEVSKDESKSFLVIPCHRTDLQQAKAQGETFLQLLLKK